jgi:gas vesicle protein
MTDHEESRGTQPFVSGLLLGALIGAGLVLLFAPQSGEETRRIIRRKAKKLAAEAEDRYDDLKDRVRRARRREKDEATAD